MEIRRLRAVVSVILALALLLPNAVITVPSARAQQGPGFGGPMGMPGGYGQPGGFGGGDFGFGGGFGYGAGFYPSYPPPPAALPPSLDKGSAAPGVCTSQTYQTLAIPRGPEIRTVATKSTITPASAESGTKADVKREEMARPDLDALSPIEAAFQVAVTPGQALAQVVFDSPRAFSPGQEQPVPYTPVTLSTPLPAAAKAAGNTGNTENDATVAKAVAAAQAALPQPAQGAPAAPLRAERRRGAARGAAAPDGGGEGQRAGRPGQRADGSGPGQGRRRQGPASPGRRRRGPPPGRWSHGRHHDG